MRGTQIPDLDSIWLTKCCQHEIRPNTQLLTLTGRWRASISTAAANGGVGLVSSPVVADLLGGE